MGGRMTGDQREKGAVTCYEAGDAEDRLANLLSILPTLDKGFRSRGNWSDTSRHCRQRSAGVWLLCFRRYTRRISGMQNRLNGDLHDPERADHPRWLMG